MRYKKSSKGLQLLVTIFLAMNCAGCTAGPDFYRPDPPASSGYRTGDHPVHVNADGHYFFGRQRFAAQETQEQWWHAFGSAKLDVLINEALQKSPTLDAANATLQASRYRYEAQAGTSLLPQADAENGASRQQRNGTVTGLEGQERNFNVFESFLTLGYTLDLSGANRRRLESLAARAGQQRWQLEAARLNLVSMVSVTAIELAEFSDRLRSHQTRIRLLEKKRRIGHEQLRLGTLSRYEALMMDKELALLKTEAAAIQRQRDATANRLVVLSGNEPGQTSPPEFSLSEFRLPENLPLEVPARLVRKRPDILASECMMRSANADYGATIAASYPRITLSTDIGSQALSLGSLFGSGSLIWGIAGSITQSLFNAGHDAEEKAALAEFDLAAANYRQTVLDALKEVADILVALEQDANEVSAMNDAFSAAEAQHAIVEAKHRLGSASKLDILDISLEKEAYREKRLSSGAKQLVDSALLFQAMGG